LQRPNTNVYFSGTVACRPGHHKDSESVRCRISDCSKMGSKKSAGMGPRACEIDDILRGTTERGASACWPEARTLKPLSPRSQRSIYLATVSMISVQPLSRGGSPQSNSTLPTWLTPTTPPPLCPQPSSTSPQSLHRMVHPFSSAGRSCQVSQPHRSRAQLVRAAYSWVT
jgi:hypothetical protein